MERSSHGKYRGVLSRNKSETLPPNSTYQGSAPPSKQLSSCIKRQCDSHFFQMKPLYGANTYFGPVHYKMIHQGDAKPYPTVLPQFSDVGLIPLFGLEKEAPQLRTTSKKCHEGLELQVSRINDESRRSERPEQMFTPFPRHKTCQVCREEFSDYQKHIVSPKHKNNVSEALGTEYIRVTIQEMQMAIFDQNAEDDLARLIELHLSLKDTIPTMRDYFKQFLIDLNNAKTSNDEIR